MCIRDRLRGVQKRGAGANFAVRPYPTPQCGISFGHRFLYPRYPPRPFRRFRAAPVGAHHDGEDQLGKTKLYLSLIHIYQSAQLVSVERNVFKELDDSLSEFFFFSIEAGVDDFLSHQFPQPFNQIQIGGVGRQENGDDLGGGYPLGQRFVLVVAGVVRDDIHLSLIHI